MNRSYNVTDAVRRLSRPSADTGRLLERLVGDGGSVRYDGSSWMHFASQPLLSAGVIESVDGFFVPGLEFESYLIEKNLSALHSAYVKANRFGKEAVEEASLVDMKDFSNALATCSTSAQKLELALEWVSTLVNQVEQLTEAVEGLIEREFGDGRE